jgi:hypothetical protein
VAATGGGVTKTTSFTLTVVQIPIGGQSISAERFGSTDADSGSVVAFDNNGNMIVTGYFSGTVDFGGGPLTSSGGTNVFLAKYSPAGAHLWSKRFGASSIYANAVAVDSFGNVIVTGSFAGVVNFGGGSLTSSYGSTDIFVAKFSPSGTHLWSKRAGDGSEDAGYGVAVDYAGNVIVTGYFRGFVDFGGGNLQSNYNNTFVAKYSPEGAHLWSKRFWSTGDDLGYSVAVDSSGNIIVTGKFWGSIDFGGGPLTSAGNYDIFVAKFSPSGTHLWSDRFGGAYDDHGLSAAVDSIDNIIVMGSSQSPSTDFGGGSLPSIGTQDIFVAKYSSTGTHLWSHRFGGSGAVDIGNSVALDSADNAIITGSFMGTVDLGGGPLTSAGATDIFAAKYSPSGVPLWSKRFGSSSFDSAFSVATVGTDAVVTGYFQLPVDFGGFPLTNAGYTDVFLIKLGQ